MKKSVLITGGSRGIGAAIVKEFMDHGYGAAFLYEKDDHAAELVCRQTGSISLKCDVSDSEAVKKAIKDCKVLLGVSSFDTVVCNAGISLSGLFTDMTDKQWKRVLDVNLSGSMYVTREVIPDMINQGTGSIVMISSMWGQTGASCEAAYAATKAAIIGLTKSLAKEVGPSGIRVNCVSPGLIETEMNKPHEGEVIQGLTEQIPLERMGKPCEVAKAVFFLGTDSAAYITGQVLGVNGGFII